MKTVDHKCPSCNASINYNPKEKNWVCEYCGSKFTLEELKANEENFEKTSVSESKELKAEKESKDKKEQETVEMDQYHCQDCGAEIIAGWFPSADNVKKIKYFCSLYDFN